MSRDLVEGQKEVCRRAYLRLAPSPGERAPTNLLLVFSEEPAEPDHGRIAVFS